MAKQLDPLNALLKHAMHMARVQQTQVLTSKSTSPIPAAGTSPDPVYQDLYQNPLNWSRGRLIALIHQDDHQRETFLGVFQELVNPRAHVRRLVRDHSAKPHGPSLPREVVHGAYWLRPQVFTPPEDSEQEAQAIRERFDELLRSIA